MAEFAPKGGPIGTQLSARPHPLATPYARTESYKVKVAYERPAGPKLQMSRAQPDFVAGTPDKDQSISLVKIYHLTSEPLQFLCRPPKWPSLTDVLLSPPASLGKNYGEEITHFTATTFDVRSHVRLTVSLLSDTLALSACTTKP